MTAPGEAKRPRLFIQGVAVKPGRRSLCSYCGGLVVRDAPGACPNCGGIEPTEPSRSQPGDDVLLAEPRAERVPRGRLREWFRLPLLWGSRRYDDWDSTRQLNYGLKMARRVAAAFDATLEEPDGSDLTVRGMYGGRRFAAQIDASGGSLLVRLRSTNRQGVLLVRRASEHLWDYRGFPDSADVPHTFIGPHIYVQERPGEFEPMMKVWRSLPDTLRRRMVKHMNATNAESVLIDSDQIGVDYDPYYALRIELTVRRALSLASRLAPVFEMGEHQVAPKPRIYLGGAALRTFSTEPCPFCRREVVQDAGGSCPECGGVLS